jgi:urease accessory protein
MNKSTSWTGIARLRFTQGEQGTRPTLVYTQAPLKVQRSFYASDSGLCQTVLVHTAGGMVGGDRLLTELLLEREAQVLITTPAAQKVYGSLGETSEQVVEITLRGGSCLDYFPLETIVFNQAQFRQDTRVYLAPHSYFSGWEITRFGRTARGERFTEGQWRSSLEIWQVQPDGTKIPLWIDRQHLLDPSALLQSPFGLDAQSVIGNLLLVGQPVTNDQKQNLVETWQAAGYQSPQFACTRTQQGLIARYRGTSSQEARQGFLHLWQTWKKTIVQQPVWMSRLWSV